MSASAPASPERRLAAIMFTDMVGFTALSQRDEALALRLLEEHRQIVRSLLQTPNGREVKSIGHAFRVEFPSSLEAVRCAIEIQSAFQETNAGRALHEDERI